MQRLGLDGFDVDEFLATVQQDIAAYLHAYANILRANEEIKQLPDEFIKKVKELEPDYVGDMPANWHRE